MPMTPTALRTSSFDFSPSRDLARFAFLAFALLIVVWPGPTARPLPQAAAGLFPPLESWRLAVLSGDAAKLKALYSTSPEPRISDLKNDPRSLQDELSFWTGWKAKGLSDINLEILQQQDPKPDFHAVNLRVALTLKGSAASKHEYILVGQGWQKQGDHWLLGITQRSDAAGLRQPATKKDIYPVNADVKKEIAEALQGTASSHKRLLLVFGGNWCYDCHVLDEAFHSPEIAPALYKSFDVLHVDIGQMDKNLDIAKQYDIPLNRGVPAIAVLDSDGKLLFSQKRGEFEAARSMTTEDILEFLNKWKPATAVR
jgi:Thioredoxin-like